MKKCVRTRHKNGGLLAPLMPSYHAFVMLNRTSGHYMYRQWSLYVPPVVTICAASCHYMYRQLSLYVPPVVTICTTSCHYMYRQLSLYVPPVVTICTTSGHYMYRQLSLYVPPLVYMYRTVVTLCTASLTFNSSTFCPTQLYLCVLCGYENKQLLFPYTALTGWFV